MIVALVALAPLHLVLEVMVAVAEVVAAAEVVVVNYFILHR